jgi:hypothetical protein
MSVKLGDEGLLFRDRDVHGKPVTGDDQRGSLSLDSRVTG